MNHTKRLLRIAEKILADVHFSTQQEFDEYLKNHPNYREDTKFYVNGVQVKAPPKQKKKPSQRSTEELVKTYGKLGETTLEYCFNSLFRAAISKNLDLNGFYKRNEKIVLEIVNGFIKDAGYKKGLTSKEAESLFEYFLSKKNEQEKKKEKDKKKEEPKKKVDNGEKREKILEQHISNFRQSSRREHFEKLNEDLRKNGMEELDEEGYREFLRDKVFNFKPSRNRNEQTIYTRKHFAKNVNWGRFSTEDVNTMNKTLTELAIDYPAMDEFLDEISQNARFDATTWAVYREYPLGWFNPGIKTAIQVNPKAKIFFENYIPYRYDKKAQELSRLRGRGYRGNVSDDGENRQEAIARNLTHEVGHKLFFQTRREDLGISFNEGRNAWDRTAIFMLDWEILRKWAVESGEISKISSYAKKNVHEFFAECFTVYRFEKENLPKNILEKMEEFLSWCSTMK